MLEMKRNMHKLTQTLFNGILSRKRNTKKHEAATASPEHFTANCPSFACRRIGIINQGRADAGTESLLDEPRFMEKHAERTTIKLCTGKKRVRFRH